MSSPEQEDLGLKKRFAKAVEVLQSLGPDEHTLVPTNEEKLQFYGLYKQATTGKCNTPRPGIFDVVGRSKWDAWNKYKNSSTAVAMEEYVNAVIQFLKRFPDRPWGAEVIEYFELSRAGLAVDSDDDDRSETSSARSQSLPDNDFDEPSDTMMHYDDPIRIPGHSAPVVHATSAVFNSVIDRVRTLESDLKTLRDDHTEQKRVMRIMLTAGESTARSLVATLRRVLPKLFWQLFLAFVALRLFGYPPTLDSPVAALVLYLRNKRRVLFGGEMALE
ncbi:acyl CoA binding protein-domain-containing protein [Phlyctochytrium arcticum]|nr:acyl CoA binding protein-domain-containing protein [Phlyctochytrium arcticum]